MQNVKQSHSQPYRVLALPRTQPGKVAAILLAAHVVLMLIFNGLVLSGQRGGDTFFSNLWLTIPFLIAGVAAISGAVIAAYAVIARHERSIFLWIAITIGLFIGMFALGEVLSPH